MRIAVITGASSGLGVCHIDAVTKLFPEIDELWLIARREERLKKDRRLEILKSSKKRQSCLHYRSIL